MPREKNTERRILPLHSCVTSILPARSPLPVLLSSLQRMARWKRLWSLIVTLSRIGEGFKVLLLVFPE